MTEVPKIVYDRLRAASPERAHPDADLLTAFAEQALSGVERDGVLQHLALCGDCREVVALALPAADMVSAPIAAGTEAVRAAKIPSKAERNWLTSGTFAWPSLRWAALAAGVTVVAAVLLLRPGKLNQAMPTSLSPQVATSVPPFAGTQIASSQIAMSPIAPSPTDQSARSAKSAEPLPKSNLQSSKKLRAEPGATRSLPAEHAILLAENKGHSSQSDNLSPAAAPAFDSAAPASREATEALDVAGATVGAAEAAPTAAGSLMARNDAPAIEKAKPAPPEMEVNELRKTEAAAGSKLAKVQGNNAMPTARLASTASPALARNITWTITAGALQRSLDRGQNWQDVLRADHPLLCYANHDYDVWTGGQAGTLFHSVDGGATWARVQPSSQGRQLSSDITHIAVHSATEVVVSAGDNEIWSTADGGQTWEKK